MEDDKLKDKEQEELRALLDTPDEGTFSDEDDQDNKGDQDEDKSSSEYDDTGDDTSSKNTKNNPEAGNGSEDNKDKAKSDTASGEEDEDKDNKDRWHGKSREEVIKAYESLEARIIALENKADSENKTDKDDTATDEKADEKTESDENEDNNPGIPSADELQKMTPTDFAKWVLGRIDEGVKRTIETQEKIRDAVHQEISDARKEHPLQDPDYRKMVLAIIDSASAKGTTIPLKDACSQVDSFLGKHKGQSENLSDEEKSRLKKAKAQVESGAGAPTQPDGSDAETKRIQKALAGSGSKSPLGGLGI